MRGIRSSWREAQGDASEEDSAAADDTRAQRRRASDMPIDDPRTRVEQGSNERGAARGMSMAFWGNFGFASGILFWFGGKETESKRDRESRFFFSFFLCIVTADPTINPDEPEAENNTSSSVSEDTEEDDGPEPGRPKREPKPNKQYDPQTWELGGIGRKPAT